MNPVVHFELPADDSRRLSAFYTSAFGWQIQSLGPEMGDYSLVTTSESDESGNPVQPGTINGGIYPREKDVPHQTTSLVVGVDNIQEAMAKIKSAGGTILGEPAEIPGYGIYVSFLDTEGNRLSIMQSLNG
jgi:uncharacterized protein